MLDALRLENLGTLERPQNRSDSPGCLTAAVAVGLSCGGKGMARELAPALGAQVVALTHGNPEAFLCGSVLAECVALLLEDNTKPLPQVVTQATDRMLNRYAIAYPQANLLARLLRHSLQQAQQPGEDPREFMDQLGCDSAPECLAGAVYAACVWEQDFDSAMILAVNHSGKSAAVGAMTGALLGAKMGVEALPEFYLESLEPAPILEELAEDLAVGSPTTGLFDDDWDHKYVQGLPVKNH